MLEKDLTTSCGTHAGLRWRFAWTCPCFWAQGFCSRQSWAYRGRRLSGPDALGVGWPWFGPVNAQNNRAHFWSFCGHAACACQWVSWAWSGPVNAQNNCAHFWSFCGHAACTCSFEASCNRQHEVNSTIPRVGQNHRYILIWYILIWYFGQGKHYIYGQSYTV